MWIVLAFITAILISATDVIIKKISDQVDPYVMAWAWSLFTLPLVYAAVWQEGAVELKPIFWPIVVISGIFLTLAMVCYAQAIRSSDLSITVPMLAFSPALLLITSPLILGEFPRPLGLIGVLLIVIGSYTLKIDRRGEGIFAPFKYLLTDRGPRFMLMVTLIYGLTANFDKIGVLNSSPARWLAALYTFLSLSLLPVMLMRSKNIDRQLKGNWIWLVALGLTYGLALICQMTAVKTAIVPFVIAIKRMSVLFSALSGFFLFGEKGLRDRLLGALLMVAGVLLIASAQ
jgi:uncharacterized membrane protein